MEGMALRDPGDALKDRLVTAAGVDVFAGLVGFTA
jgi:hypothetical protein